MPNNYSYNRKHDLQADMSRSHNACRGVLVSAQAPCYDIILHARTCARTVLDIHLMDTQSKGMQAAFTGLIVPANCCCHLKNCINSAIASGPDEVVLQLGHLLTTTSAQLSIVCAQIAAVAQLLKMSIRNCTFDFTSSNSFDDQFPLCYKIMP